MPRPLALLCCLLAALSICALGVEPTVPAAVAPAPTGVAPAAGQPLATVEKNFVTVSIRLEAVRDGSAVLVGTFTPLPKDEPLHLYATELAPGSAGFPTRMVIKAGQPAEATGPLVADLPTHLHQGIPVFPEGPVTLRLPIRLPDGPAGSEVPVTLVLTWMACTRTACMPPVPKLEVPVRLPAFPRAAAGTAAPAADAEGLRAVLREELERERAGLRQLVADEVAKIAPGRKRIAWRHPTTIAEIERLIAEAHAAGKSALLDFTGPSCSNCQLMAKSVFLLPEVAEAWNAQVPIEINTDPDPTITDDFGAWQQGRFETQARPLYVRLDPGQGDGPGVRWSQTFSPQDADTLAAFIGFLSGGKEGSDRGTGDGVMEFLLLAILGGLFTLVMPCTYPMIPFTINFFAKQAAGGRSLVPMALAYALGIVGSFTGLGILIVGVFQQNLATVAGHPITNLVFGLLFLVLGLSLLGVFLLRLPASMAGAVGGGRGGYIGALLMGLTFAITAFSCTAPFAGSVLAQAVATGSWTAAVLGMAIYSGTIAVPFLVLALSPGLMRRIPKAGEWMNEFKVVGGLVEIAAALKFLAICDEQWGWGVIGRTFTLTAWTVIAAVIASYVLGRIRLHDDSPVQNLGVGRLLTAIAFLCLALWLASGLFGQHLGVVEAWFPGDEAPGA